MKVGELKDYYGLLGIAVNSTVSEIHKAYWQQASICHPDRGGSHEEMVQLAEAWKILSDPNKRARYDQLLKYRHDGWHSNRFDDDVLNARERAEVHASRTWAEFEEIYQKAFYTFNQDFYGDDMSEKAVGPYSPLMTSENYGGRIQGTSQSNPADADSKVRTGVLFGYILKTVILFAIISAALALYQKYGGVGRYIPLQQDTPAILILDTTDGAVYSVEKRNGSFTSPKKQIVPPFPREKK